ncbi:aminotransferase class I/II-fold pyridoxal phosphate-dependent enzyme [Brevibacterium sp. 5221]|uniref:Aminotransferase class I/II-fold pyridoxal phosphate-dependent enzyme n=1 Tax=Brevibacterium rongguiense TaxID=2695267 RepID=A0A6N9H472_9MICO|nr:PLP-dependent aminotransferase family protein [Brevibacterium rongguiense]MYM18556.1 aminotransferase class I/II-fold pyridoxal phosphate-dependent enzyme [Brevibacterium rongguiense]
MSSATHPLITTVKSLVDAATAPTAGLSGAAAHGKFPLAGGPDGFVGSVIDSSTSLIAAQRHDIVRFGMGAPAAEVIPTEELKALAGEALTVESFGYGATEGEPDLIEAILGLADSDGAPTSAERISVTAGGMQGLDLAFKLFVSPGDLVAVESPTYTNGSATAFAYGADLLEIPMDQHGMDVDAFEAIVGELDRVPKAIYVIPNFQNPSGTTLSEERRRKLLDLAHRWGSVIIDDDPYGDLRFSGEHVPSFSALSPQDPQVFSVRTFSKVIAPGLRVGWVDADARLRTLIGNAKQTMDSCTNVPAQHMVSRFVTGGGYADHLARLRREYHARKDAMVAAIGRVLGERARTTDPEGGFFLWLTLQGEDAGVDTEALFETALARGVAFIPGAALSPSRQFRNAARLCFASSSPERIEEGVARLAGALDAVGQRP